MQIDGDDDGEEIGEAVQDGQAEEEIPSWQDQDQDQACCCCGQEVTSGQEGEVGSCCHRSEVFLAANIS